ADGRARRPGGAAHLRRVRAPTRAGVAAGARALPARAARGAVGRLRLPRAADDRRPRPAPAREARARPRRASLHRHRPRRRLPLRRSVRRVSGVGVRLSLALLAVVVAALGVVYVVVVPSLEGRLVGSRMSQVKRAAAALSRELPANRFDWPDFLDAAEAEAPVRVVVYDVIGPPTTLVVVGDTRGDRSTDVAGDRIALAAATRQRPASGTVVRG